MGDDLEVEIPCSAFYFRALLFLILTIIQFYHIRKFEQNVYASGVYRRLIGEDKNKISGALEKYNKTLFLPASFGFVMFFVAVLDSKPPFHLYAGFDLPIMACGLFFIAWFIRDIKRKGAIKFKGESSGATCDVSNDDPCDISIK